MARQWLFVSLYGGADAPPGLPAVVPRAARLVRAKDPGACFFFSRADDDPAGRSVDLWIDARPGTRREAAQLLRGAPESGWRLSAERLVERPVGHPHESERDVHDELASVASEFALTVRPDGTPPAPQEAYGLAVAHLRGLARLTAPAGRAGFLFQCWERWSARLTAGRRVELAVEAELREADVPEEPTEAPTPFEDAFGEALEAYLHGTRQAVRRQRPGCGLPEHYLLFAQSASAHDRLGIPAGVSAAAALAVRGELVRRPSRVPAATAGERG
ncbi:hypothetical protein OG562_11285 [Streptomyces sp. NBC_01275]|uniref:hypothetical protein n=1 Tax=Streptomyces sp. NBC_01275 TaxID=2903807 RepID=UPI00225051F4|nr:hypothetical protein [Streptomyces sp. NBC_01275]MCX4761553.1 hypothetical protein [Streptomyces sp. NBC_01275]